MPIQLMKPIAVRLTPNSRSHADRVANTSRNGRPAEKPRNRKETTRGCV
jgi:hypothetical protein